MTCGFILIYEYLLIICILDLSWSEKLACLLQKDIQNIDICTKSLKSRNHKPIVGLIHPSTLNIFLV